MPQYMKTTGSLVTVKPKKESAANQGRMLLDDALIEMLDIMLPVGELKTFATDEIDSWIAKMSEYGQEWVEPDGRLLKVSDYPDLFNLIGYNYGWSNTNPNGTYTYSFTDVNGVARSLQIYNDLEIDGNANPVEGTPAYFRIPNLAGRFLRCAGTATYVNKWTDSDNVTRHLLTEYSAPMYKGQLDAQRDITGSASFRTIEPNRDLMASTSIERVTTGAFSNNVENWAGSHLSLSSFWKDDPAALHILNLDTGRVIRTSTENISISSHVLFLLRIAWDITGGMIIRDAKGFDIVNANSSGPFLIEHKNSGTYGIEGSMLTESRYAHILFDASRDTPAKDENKPLGLNIFCSIRILWDITGRFSCSIGPNFEAYAEGSFRGVRLTEVGTGRYGTDGDVVYGHTMLGSRCVPRQNENIPVSTHVSMLIRLLWSAVIMLVR